VTLYLEQQVAGELHRELVSCKVQEQLKALAQCKELALLMVLALVQIKAELESLKDTGKKEKWSKCAKRDSG